MQGEIRSLIFELRRDPVRGGLVAALTRHAEGIGRSEGLTIKVSGPTARLPLCPRVEAQLFGIAREALANVLRHAEATAAQVRVEFQRGQVLVEICDNGHGFDTEGVGYPGHFGLESMRSRAAEIDARLTIASAPASGTAVRVRVDAEEEGP